MLKHKLPERNTIYVPCSPLLSNPIIIIIIIIIITTNFSPGDGRLRFAIRCTRHADWSARNYRIYGWRTGSEVR